MTALIARTEESLCKEFAKAIKSARNAEAEHRSSLRRAADAITALRALDSAKWSYRRLGTVVDASTTVLFRLHKTHGGEASAEEHLTAPDGGPALPLILNAGATVSVLVIARDTQVLDALSVRCNRLDQNFAVYGDPDEVEQVRSVPASFSCFEVLEATLADAWCVFAGYPRSGELAEHNAYTLLSWALAPKSLWGELLVIVEHVELPNLEHHRSSARLRNEQVGLTSFVTIGPTTPGGV